MINAFGPAMGHKVTYPQTGDVTLCCAGFNNKNEYDRQTPCDIHFTFLQPDRQSGRLRLAYLQPAAVVSAAYRTKGIKCQNPHPNLRAATACNHDGSYLLEELCRLLESY
jgi:hypothetical protein